MNNLLRFVLLTEVCEARCRFPHLDLCAHLLNLRGLLFKLRRERFHSSLLLHNS